MIKVHVLLPIMLYVLGMTTTNNVTVCWQDAER
jgi:hypothetical protein